MTYPYLYSESLTKRIMRRVYFIWFTKRVAPTLALQLTALVLMAVGIHEYISVRFVLANAAHTVSGIPSLITFTRSAVAHTEFIPRLLLGASTLLGLLVIRDILRVFRSRLGRLPSKMALLAERVSR